MKETKPIILELDLVGRKPDLTNSHRIKCKKCQGIYSHRPGIWDDEEFCSPFCRNTYKR